MSGDSIHSKALLEILLNVTQELWILRDRQIVTEQVLAEAGIDIRDKIDGYQPDAAMRERLDAERRRLIDLCLAPAKDQD